MNLLKKKNVLFMVLLIGILFLAVGCKPKEDTPLGIDVESISISGVGVVNGNLTLIKGSSMTLVASVSPSDATNKTVTWLSQSESVVSVTDGGVIVALTAGTSTITATADGKSASLNVLVMEPTLLSGISFAQSEVSVNIGSTKQLIVEFTPSETTQKSLTYQISPIGNAVAGEVTISGSGLVTASSEAIANTQYEIVAISLTNTEITASTVVTVNEILLTNLELRKNDKGVAVSSSSENPLELPINLKNNLYSFFPIYSPNNTTQIDVTFSSSDEDVVSIDQYGIYSVSDNAQIGDQAIITVTGENNISKDVYIEIGQPETSVFHGISQTYLNDLATDTRLEWDIEEQGTDGPTTEPTDDYYDTAGNKPTTSAMWRGGKTQSTFGGVSPWDGVWGVIFDVWDHPYHDDDDANQYMFNKLAIGNSTNLLKLRVRSHITQSTSDRGKFRVSLFTVNEAGEYSDVIYPNLTQGIGTKTSDNWYEISNSTVADYEAGNDYFYFDVSQYKNQTIVVLFEVDDMHDDNLPVGEQDSMVADRIAWLGAWLQEEISEDE